MPGHLRLCLIVGIVVVLLASACGGDDDGSSNAPALAPSASAHGAGDAERGTFVTVRLSEGEPVGGQSSQTVSRVDGRPLDAEEIRSVVDRLPPWDDHDSYAVDFNRPSETLPPPRTGETIDRPFPAGPDIGAPVVDSGPLEVLRVQPEGDVGIAPFVSITFNQPMVPLTTIAQPSPYGQRSAAPQSRFTAAP